MTPDDIARQIVRDWLAANESDVQALERAIALALVEAQYRYDTAVTVAEAADRCWSGLTAKDRADATVALRAAVEARREALGVRAVAAMANGQ